MNNVINNITNTSLISHLSDVNKYVVNKLLVKKKHPYYISNRSYDVNNSKLLTIDIKMIKFVLPGVLLQNTSARCTCCIAMLEGKVIADHRLTRRIIRMRAYAPLL